MAQQPVIGLLVDADLDPESLGDGVGGDVVMGGADAAGGDDVIELHPALVDRVDDRVFDIGNDASLAQPHADLVQVHRQERQIGVLGAAGQDFVADHDQAGGNFFGGHGRALSQNQP